MFILNIYHKYLIKIRNKSILRTMSQLNETTKRGAFIVFEGCDRCGKTTQSSRLVEYLKSLNIPVVHMAFPARQSPSGKLIDDYLRNIQNMPDESIHLLFAVNRWEVQDKIKQLLESGTNLVVDRYSYSGVAYSTAKGLSFDWCQAPERGLIQPDKVFYLRTDVETFSNRGDFGRERYEKTEFQKKVLEVFDQIFQKEKHYWTEVNAKSDMDSIHENVSKEAIKVIGEISNKPINLLWKKC